MCLWRQSTLLHLVVITRFAVLMVITWSAKSQEKFCNWLDTTAAQSPFQHLEPSTDLDHDHQGSPAWQICCPCAVYQKTKKASKGGSNEKRNCQDHLRSSDLKWTGMKTGNSHSAMSWSLCLCWSFGRLVSNKGNLFLSIGFWIVFSFDMNLSYNRCILLFTIWMSFLDTQQ